MDSQHAHSLNSQYNTECPYEVARRTAESAALPANLPRKLGAWRDGKQIVTFRQGRLPHLCCYTGEESNLRYRELALAQSRFFLLRWLKQWTGFGSRANVLVTCCRGHVWRTRCLGMLSAVCVLAWVCQANIAIETGAPILLPTILWLTCAGLLLILSRQRLRVTKQEGEFVWLAGGHHDFLQQLPEWEASLLNRSETLPESNPRIEITPDPILRQHFLTALRTRIRRATTQSPLGVSEAAFPTVPTYRDGDLIVTSRFGSLPAICVDTGESTALPTYQETFRQKVWSFPSTFPKLFRTRYASIVFSLSEAAIRNRRRRRNEAILWLVVGVLFCLPLCATFPIEMPLLTTLIIALLASAGLLLFGCGLGRLFMASNYLRVAKMDDHYVWLAGGSNAFLRRLPIWPLATIQPVSDDSVVVLSTTT